MTGEADRATEVGKGGRPAASARAPSSPAGIDSVHTSTDNSHALAIGLNTALNTSQGLTAMRAALAPENCRSRRPQNGQRRGSDPLASSAPAPGACDALEMQRTGATPRPGRSHATTAPRSVETTHVDVV